MTWGTGGARSAWRVAWRPDWSAWARGWRAYLNARRGAAELRALNARELNDLGLERGGIDYVVRHGR